MRASKEALDSARSAIRAGARDVTIVSLENFDEMPVLRTTQGHEEFEEAKREGVRFITRRGAKRFVGSGRLQAIELRRVTSVFDADGRFAPTYDDADVTSIEADSCILAIGQKPDLSFLTAADGVALTASGTIRVDPDTLATSAPGVFAGGDVAFGPRNLIEAVANGKRAAHAIHAYLSHAASHIETTVDIDPLPTRTLPDDRRLRGVRPRDAADARRRPPHGHRRGRNRLRRGRGAPAGRPLPRLPRADDLRPRALRAVQPVRRRLPRVLPRDRAVRRSRPRRGHARALTSRAAANGLPLAAMLKDDERCIRCGLCAIRCPTDAMTMERFTITERFAGGAAAGQELT